jgi:hypothetical protein
MRGPLTLAVLVIGAVWACSSKPAYPKCTRDQDCAVGNKHDYCVAGACVYCRTTIDCGDREMCRAGACMLDPELQPKDGGEDAKPDAPEVLDEPLYPPTDRRRIRLQEME